MSYFLVEMGQGLNNANHIICLAIYSPLRQVVFKSFDQPY